MARVKCAICGQYFDYAKEQAVRHGTRRYSHYECESNGELVPLLIKEPTEAQKKRQDKKELESYIKNLFNLETIPAKIKRQIQDYQAEYKYSYSGMLKTLIWWYDIKKNSIEKSGGGIRDCSLHLPRCV